MGFPLERGSVEDDILTCHWHYARFDVESGWTFDLWADDVPTCPIEVRDGKVILTALANLLPALPEEEAYLVLFHGARRVAADCDGEAPVPSSSN